MPQDALGRHAEPTPHPPRITSRQGFTLPPLPPFPRPQFSRPHFQDLRTRYHPTQRDACSDLQPFWLEGLFGSGQPPLLCEKAKTTRDLPGCRTDTASTPDHKRPCSTDIASTPGFLETLRFYATHGFYFTQGLYDTPAFMIPRVFMTALVLMPHRVL